MSTQASISAFARRLWPWRKPSNAGGVGRTTHQKVRITHPFHPLHSRKVELISRRRPGLGILHRQGLAAWMRALARPFRPDGERHPPIAPSPTSDFPPESNELTRLIANIVVAVQTERAHA